MDSADGNLVREDIIDFIECDTGITGQALADKILSCLRSYDVDLGKMRGQAYDGAGNMSGSSKGTAAIIQAEYPLAIYVHCASHCLNLAVVKSLQDTSKCNVTVLLATNLKQCITGE